MCCIFKPETLNEDCFRNISIIYNEKSDETHVGKYQRSSDPDTFCLGHGSPPPQTAAPVEVHPVINKSDTSWNTPYLYIDWSFHSTASLVLMLAWTELMELDIINCLLSLWLMFENAQNNHALPIHVELQSPKPKLILALVQFLQPPNPPNPTQPGKVRIEVFAKP
jgi:hypothetical protein